jgi:hypothetical protein
MAAISEIDTETSVNNLSNSFKEIFKSFSYNDISLNQINHSDFSYDENIK